MKNSPEVLLLLICAGLSESSCIVQTEPYSCEPDTTLACMYTGPEGTEDVGRCHAGRKTCGPDGTYGPCEGEVRPADEESCATPEDDDCDGEVNEEDADCVCEPDTFAPCYSGPPGTEGIGACKAGVQACDAGGKAWGPCQGEVTPVGETCTTIGDDDCDGLANEEGTDCVCLPGSLLSCYSADPATEGVGICNAGVQVCNQEGTGYGACVGEVLPAATGENCATPVDDDCDGQVNNEAAGCVCAPGGVVDCPYAGSPGTEGIGVCKAGSHMCNADGTGFLAPCSGEVVPSYELCGTIADENCDDDFGCHGLHSWSRRFGDIYTQEARGVAVDAEGNAVVTGYFKGTVDFDGNTSTGGSDTIFAAKLAPDGTTVWAKGFIDTAMKNDYGNAIAVDMAGNVFVAGMISGTVDFGCGPIAAVSSSYDVVVVKLEPDTGGCQWSKRLGLGSDDLASAVAVDAQGNVYVAGRFSGPTQFDNDQLQWAGGNDIFLAKIDGATESVLWSKAFGSAGDEEAFGLAVDGTGAVLMIGKLQGTVDFGALSGPVVSGGGDDVFVTKFNSTGGPVWSKAYGDAGLQRGYAIATDSSNNVLLTGAFASAISFGGGPLTSAGSFDIFVAKLDPAGSHLWSKQFGDGSVQYGNGIAVGPTGDVVLCGHAQGTIDFGGSPLAGEPGSYNSLAAKLDNAGNHIWSKRFGSGTGDSYALGVAGDAYGASLLVGTFNGSIDFGGGPLVSGGSYDLYVTKLSP